MPDQEKNNAPEASIIKAQVPALTAITIENFKGVNEPVTIPLRPITLLFGANSAGKSTVIQALQYAWEVLENRNADVDRTRLGGEAIDLGGFKNLVHGHDLTRRIAVALRFRGGLKHRAYLPPEFIWSAMDRELVLDGPAPNMSRILSYDDLTVKIITEWDAVNERARICEFRVGFDGKLFARITALQDGSAKLELNIHHRLFSQLEDSEDYENRLFLKIRDEFVSSDSSDEELRDLLSLALDKEPSEEEIQTMPFFFVPSVIPQWGQLLQIRYGQPVTGSAAQLLPEEMQYALSQIILGAAEAVRQELDALRYLGPLREVPDRLHAAPLHPGRERWANGLGAWDVLLRSEAEEDGSPSLVERCNDYLHETLGLGYTLRREERIQLPLESPLYAELQLIAAQYEDRDAADLRRVLDELEALPRVPALQLHDEKNDIDVDPMDIGVGVSQTLPVVVGAVEPNCTLFAVEQPELHMHPAVQSKLGDLFLKEGLTERISRIFLLETHSEHIILRILRRIRENYEGTLPAGYPKVEKDDVQVVYVENKDGETIITPLEITEDGDFAQDWPNGFFTEREEDLF